MNSIQLLAARVGPVSSDAGENEDPIAQTEESTKSGIEIRSGSRLRTFFITLLSAILFFPNLLFLQPLLYFWFVITFPLRFLEEKYEKKSDKSSEDEASSAPGKHTESKLKSPSVGQEYADLATISSIKSTTPVAAEINQLKSPTSPSSYMAAVFAKLPKVLFLPLNFNPKKHQRKVLILDLDETLIHLLSKTSRMSTSHMVEVRLNNLATLYYVYKRPFCDEFLGLVTEWYDVYVFTASAREYADPVINWLERDRKYFKKRFYREHCTLRKGAGYIKDLSILGIDLARVILVDNSPISYSLNYENALDIEGWIDDPTDNELLQLLPLLNALRFVTDVRYILGLKSGADLIG